MSMTNHKYKTLEEIRRAFEQTKARIRKIEEKAFAKLKSKKTSDNAQN